MKVAADQALFPGRIDIAGLDQNAHQPRRHRAANVGFGVIANHRNGLCRAAEALDSQREKHGRRLAQHQGFAIGGIFESGDKGAEVEAQFAVTIEKFAIFRQRQKFGAAQDLRKASLSLS